MSSVYATNCTPKSQHVLSAADIKHVYTSPVTPGESEPMSIVYAFDAGHHGRITVQDRRTGYSWRGNGRDTETGFNDSYAMNARGRANYGKNFWLASGYVDIREWLEDNGPKPWDECVQYVKHLANTCIGVEE